MCATDDFQKSRKNAIFENRIKNLSFEKIEMFDVFLRLLDQFVAACILIVKHFTQKHLSSKMLFFAFFNQKTFPKHH